MKKYKAMIWKDGRNSVGQRAVIMADSLDDARRRLEAKYGEGTVFDLHNEEEANRPR
jgi:hypothetical protein